MKKILSLILVVACCFGCVIGLASCSKPAAKIAVQSGTTSEMYANLLADVEVASYETFALAASDMKNGNADYVFVDKTTAYALLKEIDGLKVIENIPL